MIRLNKHLRVKKATGPGVRDFEVYDIAMNRKIPIDNFDQVNIA